LNLIFRWRFIRTTCPFGALFPLLTGYFALNLIGSVSQKKLNDESVKWVDWFLSSQGGEMYRKIPLFFFRFQIFSEILSQQVNLT